MRSLICGILLVGFSFSTIFAADPLITVSKETTYVTEPVNEDGFVDLVTAINAIMSEGVTTETNAAALIFPALGPKPDGTQMSKRFFEELGVPYPAEEGNYFQTLPAYLRGKKPANSPEERDQLNEVQDNQGIAAERPWTRDEFPEIAAWVDAQEEPLKQILEGIQREHYYCPINTEAEKGTTGQMLIATLLPHIQTNRSITRVLACRAMLRASEGKTEEAWHDLMASYRFGRHASHDPFLISRLVGIAMESITNQAMVRFLEATNPDETLCQKYAADLETLPERSPMYQSIDLGERLMFLDIVAMLAYQQGNEDFAVGDVVPEFENVVKKGSKINADWDLVLKNANQWYDRMVDAIKDKTYKEQLEAYQDIDDELVKIAKKRSAFSQVLIGLAIAAKDKTATTNFISNTLVALILPAANQAAKAELRIQQRDENLKLTLALLAYRAREGEYPTELDALTPNDIKSLPQDLYTEESLTYSKTENGFLLYSFGENLEDDGGKSFDERKDDILVRIPSSLE